MDFGTQVLSGGWYAGKGFWTVDVSIKGLANIRAPKTLFEFMKKGNGSNRNSAFFLEFQVEGRFLAFLQSLALISTR